MRTKTTQSLSDMLPALVQLERGLEFIQERAKELEMDLVRTREYWEVAPGVKNVRITASKAELAALDGAREKLNRDFRDLVGGNRAPVADEIDQVRFQLRKIFEWCR